MNTKRLITLALGGMMLASPAYLAAQQDQESVADAARKAQEQKKNAPKAKLTIDNDNLGTLTGTVNVVGQEPAPPEDQTKKPAAPNNAAPSKDKDEAYWRGRFTDANKKLADDQHEMDITQRELNLKQQQFYTDPMAALKQDYSRQDINDSKTKIDELKARVEQDKADLANLEDELRQAGGNPGWATPSSQPAAGTPATEQPPPDQSAPQQPAPAAPAPVAPAPAPQA
jgi:chromosome segregation ATPase